MKKISEMTTKELVEEYNERTGKTVKKFSTRANGERMVSALREKERESNPEAHQEPIKNVNRSKGISESWNDVDIAEKRKARHHCSVDGVVYRSVKYAFEQLGLPLAKHIPFRMRLRDEGKVVFEHEDKKYTFELAGA